MTVPTENQRNRRFELAFCFLGFLVLPLGGLLGLGLLWGIACLAHPSYLSAFISEAPVKLQFLQIVILAIFVSPPMWFSYVVWKYWMKRSKLIADETLTGLDENKFPADLERRRGPGFVTVIFVTALTMCAEVLRRFEAPFHWVVLVLVVAVGAGCLVHSFLLNRSVMPNSNRTRPPPAAGE